MNESILQVLRNTLEYDPETGVFIRRKNNKIAGTRTKRGYIEITVSRKRYYAHRLAWLYHYGEWPKEYIDHINHNKIDNRITNLREANKQENQKNGTLQKNNTSGFVGVYYSNTQKKWRSQIKVNGSLIHLGIFDTLQEAVDSRAQAHKRFGFHENHGRRLSSPNI